MRKLLKNKKHKTIFAISALLISWFLVHETVITIDGLTDETPNSDIAVILGTKVNPDGTLSDRLKSRLDKGLELYKSSIATRIFVTGGLGKEGYNEGDVMAEYLISQGVPKSDIIIDNKGNTTQLSAENFKSMFSDTTSIIIVSQFFHISRTKLTFKKQGFKNIGSAHCEHYETRDIYSITREFFGYYKYLFLSSSN